MTAPTCYCGAPWTIRPDGTRICEQHCDRIDQSGPCPDDCPFCITARGHVPGAP